MRTLARLALVAVVAAAAGCTGDDDDDDGATTTTVADTKAPVVETTDAEPPAATLTFGVMAPGDDLAELAGGQQLGLDLALEDIAAAGGVLGGSVATVRVDESVDESIDTTVELLLADGANAILGPVGSATAAQVAALAREERLLACSASATAASVTFDGTASTFFRTAMRDDDTALVVADEIMDDKDDDDDREPPRTVIILGREDIYGVELAGDLSAQLTARGATVDTILYPARRVEFAEEVEAVVDADPDLVVVASFGEGIALLAELAAAGHPMADVVGLDGLSRPDLAGQIFPDDPARADGLRIVRATGDRLITERLEAAAGTDAPTLYGAQMYDCAVTIALAAEAAGSAEPAAIGAQIERVTTGGRTCSTYAHCKALLAAGEAVAYSGASGGLEIGPEGDISTTRLTTSAFEDGALVEVSTRQIDLIAERRLQILSSAVVMTQVQQALKLLGYFDGDITGFHDAETAEALRALQRDLGVPETGEYDAATDEALRARLGATSSSLRLATSQLQLELQALGYYDGPIDGRYSEATAAAVRAFQIRIGVPPTGLLDSTTLRQVYVLGQQNPLQPPPPPPPAPPVTEPPAPPVTEAPAPPVTEAPAPPVTEPPPLPPVTEPPPPPPPPPATTVPEATTTTTEPEAEPEPEPSPTMYDVLVGDPDFSTFLGLVRSAGFARDLDQPAPAFTLFAPTNAAFDAMDEEDRAEWTQDPTRLRALLAYHGAEPDAGVLASGDFRTGPLRSVHGALLDIVGGDEVTVNGAALGGATDASNGIVHSIGAVLVPPP